MACRETNSGTWLWPTGLVAIALTVLPGCAGEAGSRRPESAASVNESRDVEATHAVTILRPPSYDHRILLPPTNWPAMHLLYSPLFEVDEQGLVRGKLVRRWEISDDGRTWTYHLRTDVTWHDGVPVTAEDYRFTVQLNRDQHRELPTSRSVEILDDSTVRVTFGDNSQDPLDDYAVLLPSHLLAGLDADALWEWEYWEHPVGNGPYRWLRRDPNLMVELEAYTDYAFGRPEIQRVTVQLGAHPLVELQAGNADVAGGYPSIPVNQLPALREDPDLRLYWAPDYRVSTLFLNHAHPALADPRVRRALTLAIDRRSFQRLREIPDEMPFWDVPLSPSQMRRGEYPDPLPHEPELARQLLSEAGWRDSDGDGVRDREGSPLSIEFLALTWNESARLLQFIQAQLQTVGVRVEIQPVQRHVAEERLATGDYGAFGLAIIGETFWSTLLGDGFEGGSPTGYWNSRLAELAMELQQTLVPEEQDRINREMWPILHEEVPVLFLGPGAWFTAAHRRVRGLESPLRAFPETLMGELWIEEDNR
jgi:peptide/nickel transport system substrate-binding protein